MDRIVSALTQFHRNRRELLKSQGRDTSKIHETLTTTGDVEGVMDGVEATPEELIALSDLRYRNSRRSEARNAKWALSGLATEMTMHETNGLLSSLEYGFRSLKDRYPNDKLVDGLQAYANIVSRNLQFLSRFKVSGYRSTGRTATIIEMIKSEFGTSIGRGSMVLQVEDRFVNAPFNADRNLIEAVFLNLVRNAYYWGSQDDQKPVIKLDAETITVPPVDLNGEEWEREPTYMYLLSVEDNGPGVPEDQFEAIFEPGISHRNSSGIGLHLCRANLEAHGYTVILDSNRSSLGGARFIVGPKSHLNPTPRPDQSRSHQLAAAALALCELLEAGHTNELLSFSDVYGEIQSEVMRIKLEGAEDEFERVLEGLDERIREGLSHVRRTGLHIA